MTRINIFSNLKLRFYLWTKTVAQQTFFISEYIYKYKNYKNINVYVWYRYNNIKIQISLDFRFREKNNKIIITLLREGNIKTLITFLSKCQNLSTSFNQILVYSDFFFSSSKTSLYRVLNQFIINRLYVLNLRIGVFKV